MTPNLVNGSGKTRKEDKASCRDVVLVKLAMLMFLHAACRCQDDWRRNKEAAGLLGPD